MRNGATETSENNRGLPPGLKNEEAQGQNELD